MYTNICTEAMLVSAQIVMLGFYNIDGKKELNVTHVICKLWKAKVKYFGNPTKLRTCCMKWMQMKLK